MIHISEPCKLDFFSLVNVKIHPFSRHRAQWGIAHSGYNPLDGDLDQV